MNAEMVSYLTVSVLLAFGYLVSPLVWRPRLFFAVSVPEDFRASREGVKILRNFRLGVVLVSLISLTLLFTLQFGDVLTKGTFFLLMGVQCLALTAVFSIARRAALPRATAVETRHKAALQPWPTIIPGGILLAVGPLVLICITAMAAILQWDALPLRIPTHWSLSGADAWIEPTPSPVAGFLLTRVFGVAILVVAASGMIRFIGRTVTTGEGARAEARFRRVTVLLVVFTGYLLAVQAVTALFLTQYAWSPTLMVAVQVLIPAAAVGCLLTLYLMGQGGNRLTGRESQPVGDHRSDSLWKLGLFYVNRDDPALFVENRFGVGYALNLGNRWSWLALALIPLMIASIVFF